MPSAAWIAAAKKTPLKPVFYVACESVDAINVEQKLVSDWLAGSIDNLETFDRPGGGAGIRPKLYTYDRNQVTWWAGSNDLAQLRIDGFTFVAPTEGFLEHVRARWNVRQSDWIVAADTIFGVPVQTVESVGMGIFRRETTSAIRLEFFAKGLYTPGSTVPFAAEPTTEPGSTAWNFYGSSGLKVGLFLEMSDTVAAIYPGNTTEFQVGFRVKTGAITTAPFDLGTVPNVNSRILIDDTVTGASSIAYVCEGSNTGTGDWTSLGAVTDGREVAPYRYYRFHITMVSTGYDTPELYSIRIVGGNQQMVYLGTHRGEPALPSGEVQPYLQKVSSISSKIALKDKPTVGDLTLDLAWLPLTSDLVQSTGKRRSVTVYLGFAGLAREDYEPYFTGLWESYTADQDRRTFTVNLRDVWKKFKKKVPEQPSRGGILEEINRQFGQAPTGAGTALNIIDAIVQVADMAKAPDRFIDREAFATLKTAHYTDSTWNVYRVLTDQKESDELLKELAVTAGLFLVPAPNGKLTPYHYETIAASTPVVTLDAAQIRFTNLTPDMAETVTRHNIFFNLIEDSQGRRSGGSPEDYSHVYTTAGSVNSVVAERDREEVVTGEWFDNWGLAAGVENGVPNPLTQLADRLESWYTPIATVAGKQVATTKSSVRAENVPLRYFGDVMPGMAVFVDNLRLPCPIGEWGGFSSQVKFLVMGRDVDTRNYTLTLDLFQIAPLTYTQNPTWHSYSHRGLLPPVSSLSVVEQTIPGSDGIARPALHISFVPPSGHSSGTYEVWVSEGGAPPVLQQNIPAAQAGTLVSISIPAQSGVQYIVTVITVSAGGSSIPVQDAPTAAVIVGTVARATTGLLQLLNPEVTSEAAADYFSGKKGMLALFDTRSMVFEAGVTEPGVTATYTEAINQVASAMSKNRDQIDALNSIVSGLVTSNYLATEAYVAGEFVTGADSKIYRAIIDVPINTPPPNATYWELTSDIVTLVNTIQQNLDEATATWESVASSLTTDVESLIDPATGRVTLAETAIEQNAAGLDIVGQSITGPPIFLAGVVEPGVQIESPADVVGLEVQVSQTRIKLDTANAAIILASGRIDTLTGRVTSAEIAIDGANAEIGLHTSQISGLDGRVSSAEIDLDAANAAILLRATKDELDGEVEILSNMIGLKLDAGPISAGLAIEWTDETHTKSRITAYSDTFRVMQPDGTGARTVFTVGSIDGVPAVGINGADLFVDGSILARHIAVDQLVVGDNVTMGPDATISWAQVTNQPDIPTLPDYITSTKITATTIESPTVTAGTFTGSTFQTSETGKRFVVSSDTNEARFYGDRGDGLVVELASIGIIQVGSDYTVGSFGAAFSEHRAITAISGTETAIYAQSTSGYALSATSNSIALNVGSTGDVAALFMGNAAHAPVLLNPQARPSSPKTVGGEIYFDSNDKHFYGWTGTAWKQLDN